MTRAHDVGDATRGNAVDWMLRNLRSAFAWKCADAADAALRFAQRLEPDISTSAECRRSFDAGLAAGREEYAATAPLAAGREPATEAAALSVAGSGVASVAGSGVASVAGSGARSVAGSAGEDDRPRLSVV